MTTGARDWAKLNQNRKHTENLKIFNGSGKRKRLPMLDTDYIFPRHKITLAQVKACKGMTKKDAYEKLGVSNRVFYTVIKSLKLGYLFHSVTNKVYFIGLHRITFDQARECKGLTIAEAADKLGVSYYTFDRAAKEHKMMDLYKKGYPSKDSERYRIKKEKRENEASLGINLERPKVECYKNGCKTKVIVHVWPGTKPSKYHYCPKHKPGTTSFYEDEVVC